MRATERFIPRAATVRLMLAFATLAFLAQAVILFGPGCGKKKGGKISATELRKIVFAGEKAPADSRILLQKRINLDDRADLEIVALIAHRDAERFALLKKSGENYRRVRFIDFAVSGLQGKKKGGKGLGQAIQRVSLRPIGKGAKRNSVLLEYLAPGPGGVPYSHMMIFTGFSRVFDSSLSLARHPLLNRLQGVPYRFSSKGELEIFYEDSGYRAQLRFNGREFTPWYPGEPLVRFIGFTSKPAPARPGFREGTLELMNIGGFALITYISLSFPGKEEIKIGKTRGSRLYGIGSRIFNRRSRSIGASYPLLEVTRRSWRPWHRLKIRFFWKPGKTADKKPMLLVRTAIRRGTETIHAPLNKEGLSARTTDQQGYPAYVLPLR